MRRRIRLLSRSIQPRVLLAIALVLAAAGAASVVLTANPTDRFPHERHQRLFPLCSGCHAGVETGDRAAFYPEPAMCANCHDGTIEPVVEWTGPREYLTNLAFEHPAHQTAMQRVDNTTLECEQCHTVAGEPRMTIQRANPELCLSCHGHQANNHYVDAPCATCHVPFVESDLPPARMLALPLPDDHRLPGFIMQGHGSDANVNITKCAVCHTQERCTSCHVNAADVPAIGALPAAPPGWTLPDWVAQYPVPPSHLSPRWIEQHGTSASAQSCAACHVQEDCTACHVTPAPAIIDTLYARAEVAAPGTGTQRRIPLSHASRFFERDHAALAASQPESCSACHEKRYCAECHDTPLQPSYHPRNFTAQHAAAAYSRRLECASCHEVRTFCRACHVQMGMQTQGRLDPGFHDAEPLWLLRHARAARQGLESCTACHTQRDCLQCHSQIGAFQVSPHGPNFDARRAQRRNPTICFACHVADPLRGGG